MKISREILRSIIEEAYIDYRDDSALAPQTAALLADVFIMGCEKHPDVGFVSPDDKIEMKEIISYTMMKHPAVARKLYGHFEEMRMDADREREILGYDLRAANPEEGGEIA